MGPERATFSRFMKFRGTASSALFLKTVTNFKSRDKHRRMCQKCYALRKFSNFWVHLTWIFALLFHVCWTCKIIRFFLPKFKNCWTGPSSSKPFNRYQELFSQWVKPLGREADHSAPSRAKAKNQWSEASVPPPHTFMTCCSPTHPAVSWHSNTLKTGDASLLDPVVFKHSTTVNHKSQPIPCQG